MLVCNQIVWRATVSAPFSPALCRGHARCESRYISPVSSASGRAMASTGRSDCQSLDSIACRRSQSMELDLSRAVDDVALERGEQI